MAKPEQERANLMFQAQQCDEEALGLTKRADGLEFISSFPTAAEKLRDAAQRLTEAAAKIRGYLRNTEA